MTVVSGVDTVDTEAAPPLDSTTGSLILCRRGPINDRKKKRRVWWSYKRNWFHRNSPLATTVRLSSCRVNVLPRLRVAFQVKGAPLYLLVSIGPRLHLIMIAIRPSLLLEALREPGAHL